MGKLDLKEFDSSFLIKLNCLWGKSTVWRKLLQKVTSKIVFPHTTKNLIAILCFTLLFPLLFSSSYLRLFFLFFKNMFFTQKQTCQHLLLRGQALYMYCITLRVSIVSQFSSTNSRVLTLTMWCACAVRLQLITLSTLRCRLPTFFRPLVKTRS